MNTLSRLELNAQIAVQKARNLLPTEAVGGVMLTILEEDVYSQHDFWHIPVRPGADPCSLSELLETLAQIETTLQLDYGLNVMINLGDPEPEESGAEVEEKQSGLASTIAA